MSLDHIKLTGETDGSGDLTIISEAIVKGTLARVEWIDGDLADGVDAVLSVTSTPSGVDHTLLVLTNANVDANYYPRAVAHDGTGTAVTYDGTNEIYVPDVFYGTLKLVISSGGASATGGCVVYYHRG